MATGWPASVQMNKMARYSDLGIVVLVVLIIVMMVVPMPPALLDVLLATNISLALLILMLTMNVTEPLQFAAFPSLLLVTTLFRLALNVSSTRLILLEGYAGQVIQAFGNFVVGGNYVVGFVVFLILVVIQFVVITRGAERVAEVAARFTLDAMPGKQMSIDADLNAGLITEEEARRRRADIEREADFYGAMDGAAKFVKGDAIAGIIITVINILGGFSVGALQKGMSLQEALQKYTLLTVGDGLVSQIPALLISTATGIIVTRAASDGSLGRDLGIQLLSQPRVLALASGVLLLFAVIPGLPTLPFLVLAALLGTLAYVMRRAMRMQEQRQAEVKRQTEIEEQKKPQSVMSLLQVDPIELEIGYNLIPLVDTSAGGDLLDRITMIRRQCALELGLVVPPIRIRDNMQLKPGQYVIKIKGVEVAGDEILAGHYLAMDSGGATEKIRGISTKEPAFGLPALWISESEREKAEMAGYTVVDGASVVATHLSEIIRSHAAEILGRQEVKSLIDNLKQDYPAVVEELIPDLMSLGEVQKVLQNLLREGVSIRNMVTILEALADASPRIKDIDQLTEEVRRYLSRQICKQVAGEDNVIPVVTLTPDVEQRLREELDETSNSGRSIDPGFTRSLVSEIGQEVQKATHSGQQVCLLVSPSVRSAVRRLTERTLPRIPVLSYSEVVPEVQVRPVGKVSLAGED